MQHPDHTRTRFIALTKWEWTFIVFWELTTTPLPPLLHLTPLPVCLSLSLLFYFSFFCLPVFKRVSSWPVWDFITLALVITSQLWSCWYRRNKRWKKRKSGKKRQIKCRSVEMCSGQFLSLFLSVCVSLSLLGPQLKRLRDPGWKYLSPTPASLLPRADWQKLRQCYLLEKHSNDRRWMLAMMLTMCDRNVSFQHREDRHLFLHIHDMISFYILLRFHWAYY